MTSFQPSVLGAEVWPLLELPGFFPHLWLIPCWSKALPRAGVLHCPWGALCSARLGTAISPSQLLGCPWHSLGAAFVTRKGWHGSAQLHKAPCCGGCHPEPAEEQLQKPCFSCLPAGKPSPRIPGMVLKSCWLSLPVPATPGHGTCCKHLFSDGVGTSSEPG